MLVVDKRCLIIEYIHSLSLEEVPPGCDPPYPGLGRGRDFAEHYAPRDDPCP